MIAALKLLALTILIGTNTEYWGHTFLAEGNDKIYALRSLNSSSSICVFDNEVVKNREGVVELSLLKAPMTECVTEGKESCHVILLPREAVVSDYASGTLSLFPLDDKGCVEGSPRILHFEGSGPHPKRQKSPHIHSSALSPDGKMLVAIDLGTDRIYRFGVSDGRVSEKQLSPIMLPAGCGPRFSVFSPEGDYLYVVTELSDEVLVYRTSDFVLRNRYPLHTANPEGGAHIALSPDGRYLYASLRVSRTAGENSCEISDGIAIYKCLKGGALKKLYYQPTGAHPRHFAISADGRALVVACRDDDVVELYHLDSKSGLPSGGVDKYSVKAPVYVGLR